MTCILFIVYYCAYRLSIIFLLLPQIVKLLQWIRTCGRNPAFCEIILHPCLLLVDGVEQLGDRLADNHDYRFLEVLFKSVPQLLLQLYLITLRNVRGKLILFEGVKIRSGAISWVCVCTTLCSTVHVLYLLCIHNEMKGIMPQ